jgi:hypothetical protein
VRELLLDANASGQLLQHLHRIEQQKPQWLKTGMWVIYWQKNASTYNTFAPTRTLLNTYNRHDHDPDHDPDHHHHHHIMIIIIIALKFAFPSEQYVDWGNDDINFF